MDIYNLLENWGLIKNQESIQKFTKREIAQFMEDVELLYGTSPIPKIGSVSPGIYDSLSMFESSGIQIASLSSMILLSDKVWLPDPIFSAVAPSASAVWSLMPDAGNPLLTSSPPISIGWKPLTRVVASQRKATLRKLLSTCIEAILRLRELYEIGAIGFYSWERLIEPGIENLPETIESLRQSGVINAVTTQYDQNQYTLGARLGPIGIEVQEADHLSGVEPGDRMFIGDKSHMLAYGLLNAQVAESLGCRFYPKLPGDRIVYDFIRTNGMYTGKEEHPQINLTIPSFSNAVFGDLAKIREDSELLVTFRSLMTAIAEADSMPTVESIRSELEEVSAKLLEDSPLRRALRPSRAEMTLGLLGGVVGAAVTGGTLIGVAAAIASPVAIYLGRLALTAYGGEAKQVRLRNEVIARVIEKL